MVILQHNDDKHLKKYAKIVELDLARLNEDMENHVQVSRIREDFLWDTKWCEWHAFFLYQWN
jgi:hypothetical protein